MQTSSTLKIKVIVGSTRQKRFSEKPAQWIFEEAKKREGIEAELLDLRDYPLPFFDEPISPSMAKKGEFANEMVAKLAKKIDEADGFIIVTPEYNYGYPAVLKNIMDHIFHEWNNKAVGFVSYGSVSGSRSIEQLKQVAIGLQMAPIRASVHIPAFWTLTDESGKLKTESLQKSADGFLTQLIWWVSALKVARSQS
jgi:NAD(P)H-dependent FMN reductase